MAYTEAEVRARIATLEAEGDRAEQSVSFADRSVSYRSSKDRQDQLAYWNNILASLSETTHRPKQSFGVASKGF